MLGYQINRSIVSLPQTLMKLTFRGYALNQPIPALPLLIHLHIESSNFNKPLDQQQPPSNLLPTSLTHLFLFSCEHPITHFPPNLTHLSFGCTFNQSIIGKLSQTLQSLELGYSFFLPLRSLPPSLKSLSVTRRTSRQMQDLDVMHKKTEIPLTLAALIVKVCCDSFGIGDVKGPELHFTFPPNEI